MYGKLTTFLTTHTTYRKIIEKKENLWEIKINKKLCLFEINIRFGEQNISDIVSHFQKY